MNDQKHGKLIIGTEILLLLRMRYYCLIQSHICCQATIGYRGNVTQD